MASEISIDGGRVVLINSTPNSLPTHVMQCILLPQNICDSIDGLNRNCLWGSSEGRRRLHLVSWETVTHPKSEGGLGINRFEGRNLALLGQFARRTREENRP